MQSCIVWKSISEGVPSENYSAFMLINFSSHVHSYILQQLKFMHTPHQFLLLSSPPAKESNFRAAKNLYGSTFAFQWVHIFIITKGYWNAVLFLFLPFEVCSCESTVLKDFWCHSAFYTVNFTAFFFILFSGSHIENWHSILRNGLVVASNTRLQVNRQKRF